MLLQILEDGHLSDAKGHKVDFQNTIILMTSNVGADVIGRSTTLGFARSHDKAQGEREAYDDMKDKVLTELKRIFRPEFLNRLDGTIVFHALTRDQIEQIVDLEIDKVCTRLDEHALHLSLTDAAREYLAEKGYDSNLGARPLRRLIQTEVEDTLSEGVLAGRFAEGDTIIVDVQDDELSFHAQPAEAELPATEAEEFENGETPPALETVLG
jgi:ATP-dependent Clp protease ATP-binding subunit ClpC